MSWEVIVLCYSCLSTQFRWGIFCRGGSDREKWDDGGVGVCWSLCRNVCGWLRWKEIGILLRGWCMGNLGWCRWWEFWVTLFNGVGVSCLSCWSWEGKEMVNVVRVGLELGELSVWIECNWWLYFLVVISRVFGDSNDNWSSLESWILVLIIFFSSCSLLCCGWRLVDNTCTQHYYYLIKIVFVC